jgi:hypothetical protein
MDELIRELEELATGSRELRDEHRTNSAPARYYNGEAQAYAHAAKLAREAKRRMAEREPTWDIR